MTLRGSYVRTQYGWGICSEDEIGSLFVRVSLDWRLPGKRRVPCTVRRKDIIETSFCAAGQCVSTIYGTGVVLCFRTDGFHQVQLWSTLGRGRTFAYLRRDAFIKLIPAAVGLSVDTPYGKGMCVGYRESRQAETAGLFLVNFSWGTASLRDDCVQCPVAQVLPLINRFLEYASALVRWDVLFDLRTALQGLGLDTVQERLASSAAEAVQMASSVWAELEAKDVASLRSKATEWLDDPQMGQLRSGMARINQLLCTAEGFDGRWIGRDDRQPRCVVSEALITWHWGETSELEVWGSDSVSMQLGGEAFRGTLGPTRELAWSDGDIWVMEGGCQEKVDSSAANTSAYPNLLQSSLDQIRTALDQQTSLSEDALECLAQVALKDPEVQKVSEALYQSGESLKGLKGEVLSSKTGQILQEGQTRMVEKLHQLHERTITPQFAQMQAHSGRLLTRLSTDRKVKQKALELCSATQTYLSGRFGIEDTAGMDSWLQTLRGHVLEHLGLQRAMLVDSLSGLRLDHLDLRHFISSSWDPVSVESQLQVALVRAIKESGLDSSGTELLDQFESSESISRIPALQKIHTNLLELIEESGIVVPLPIRKLLETQACGHLHDVETWKVAFVKSLDDDDFVNGASTLVQKGEEVLTQIQGLADGVSLASVMDHFESEHVNQFLLKGLQELDTEALIKTAENALTNAEAREQLVSKLKDGCLDFVLSVLPSINIEKYDGNGNGCDWEINNISFSDFHFLKENVHVKIGEPGHGELLRLDAWEISAHFRGMKVSVDQVAWPNLHADGVADALAQRMSVSIAFHLHTDSVSKIPRLYMSSRSVAMEELDITIADSSFAPIVNALTYIFAEQLKVYVCEKIADRLDGLFGSGVQGLNSLLVTCAPLLRQLGWELSF